MTTNAHILAALNSNRDKHAIAEHYGVSYRHVKYLAVGFKRGSQDKWADGSCPLCGFITGRYKTENWDTIEHVDLCGSCVAELQAGRIHQGIPADLLESWGYATEPPPIIYDKSDFAYMAPQLNLILRELDGGEKHEQFLDRQD